MVHKNIVDDTPVGIAQQAIPGLLRPHVAQIANLNALQECQRVRSRDFDLAHVVDVEQPGVGSHGLMLDRGAEVIILHRQFPTGKRHDSAM